MAPVNGGRVAGARAAMVVPLTMIANSLASTVAQNFPYAESNASRCASVFASVMPLTAPTSKWARAASPPEPTLEAGSFASYLPDGTTTTGQWA